MISFDELFAHRIYYQDVSFDEFYIIKKLKQILINDGMNENNTNKYLYDFYIHFGHSMSIEDIESVRLSSPPNQNIFTSFFNLLNSYQSNNQDNNNQEINEDNNQEINEDNNQENDESEQSNNNSSDADIEDNVLTPSSEEENTNSQSPNQEHIHIDFSLNLPHNINNSSVIENNENLHYNIFGTMPYFLINNNLNAENNNQITFEYNNLLDNTNMINQIMGQIINIPNQNNQEDINITMDKNDIDNLKILKYSKESLTNCSICLMDVCKDDYYYEIKCNHIFHKKCLEKWLEEYNYICPVCRTELGNSKAHLENEENSISSESSSIDSADNV